MDMLFFLVACLGLAETIDLFMGKDFLLFYGKNVKQEHYDLPKVYAVEKWLFAADTIGCFLLTRGSFFGYAAQLVILAILMATLVAHAWVFNADRFLTKAGLEQKQKKKEARIAWRNRKKKQ